MPIPLDLRHHCIETAARRLYNRKLARYFKDRDARQRLETEIELLKTALETFDFSRLRSDYPVLAGNCDCSVALKYDKQGNLVLVIDDDQVEPPCRG